MFVKREGQPYTVIATELPHADPVATARLQERVQWDTDIAQSLWIGLEFGVEVSKAAGTLLPLVRSCFPTLQLFGL